MTNRQASKRFGRTVYLYKWLTCNGHDISDESNFLSMIWACPFFCLRFYSDVESRLVHKTSTFRNRLCYNTKRIYRNEGWHVEKIMIVEDDPKIAEYLRVYIEKYNFDVIVATDFEHLMDTFRKHMPELVLLDINLPSFDGFYWCRQIRLESICPVI